MSNFDNMYRYTSKKFIYSMLERMGKKPTKGLGQNFLIDSGVIEDIVEYAGLNEDIAVLEIGAGLGALTYALIQNSAHTTSIEIDNKLWDYLEEEFGEWQNFTLVKGDVLRVDLKQICEDLLSKADKIYLVANLPYHITTPIIMKFLEENLPIDKIIVMVQKEVALRMSAEPCSKDYGALTVNLNTFADMRILFDIDPSSFMPMPKVDSSVIEIAIKEEKPIADADRDFFLKLVKAAFHSRRKKLANSVNLAIGIPKEKVQAGLASIGKDMEARAETLSPSEFIALARVLSC
ncbi:MAG: 16S rRNA (adenine(1518)-N(6)/adenine(1519)-N(6))-dimethyltransferase RsmA [Bacillota bacterium]|nr:16S rRNA (adenine(1518)-N(6)/adenine(1519)-N(6))-dimethyltransferase RsmA [Bacillota bacterium]